MKKVYISGNAGILMDEEMPEQKREDRADAQRIEIAAFTLEAALLLWKLGFTRTKTPIYCFRERREEETEGRTGKEWAGIPVLMRLLGHGLGAEKTGSRETQHIYGLLEGGEAVLVPSGDGEKPFCFATLEGKICLEGAGWNLDALEDVPLSEAVPLLRAFVTGHEEESQEAGKTAPA